MEHYSLQLAVVESDSLLQLAVVELRLLFLAALTA
jgi:hypothetical protein